MISFSCRVMSFKELFCFVLGFRVGFFFVHFREIVLAEVGK